VQGVSISTASSMDVQGVSISTASSMDVQGVSISTASSMDVQGVSISTASSMDGRAGCNPFVNAGMSDCPASSQSESGMNKNADAGTSPVPE
jgi:hypothetical protein